MNRPLVTMFMLMSLDGKISTGAANALDFDSDLPKIPGVKEGLHQYYELEQTTSLWSICTGKTKAKLGANEKAKAPRHSKVSHLIFDNISLTAQGVEYLASDADTLVIVTSNEEHPAVSLEGSVRNLYVYCDRRGVKIEDALEYVHRQFGCDEVTLQGGGTLNASFVRSSMVDFVDVVVAPLLVGGVATPTLVSGPDICYPSQLSGLGILKLEGCEVLKDNYVRLRYSVVNHKKPALASHSRRLGLV